MTASSLDTRGELLWRIRENPVADLPRLAYADWLDDHGTADDAARAEFIRAQCELATLSGCLTPSVGMRESGSGKPLACWQCRPRNKRDCQPWCGACARADALWAVERKWVVGNRRAVVAEIGLEADVWLARQLTPNVEPGTPLVSFDRGFISEVRLTLAAFVGGGACERCGGGGELVNGGRRPLKCPACSGTGTAPGFARAIFAAHPVVTVRLVDREPYCSPEAGYCWRRDDDDDAAEPHHLPVALFDLLPLKPPGPRYLYAAYDTRQAALDALSNVAAPNYGRGLAGLPPLPGGAA